MVKLSGQMAHVKMNSMKTIDEIRKNCHGDVFPIKEFIHLMDIGAVTPHDGVGYFHDGKNETEFCVWNDHPGGCTTQGEVIKKFPYVCWYNK